MKRIVVLLSAILLIFIAACSGDNPAPSGGNAGTNVPGGENVPPVTDGNLPDTVIDIIESITASMEGSDVQHGPWRNETVREHYSVSDELVLKNVTVLSGDGTGSTPDFHQSNTIEADGYVYLKKGSSIMVGVHGDPSNINSVMIDDTTYDSSNGETFEAVCAEVKDLYSRIDHTVENYVSTESYEFKIDGTDYKCDFTLVSDLTFGGMSNTGSASTGTVVQSYKLDGAYKGIQEFSTYMVYINSTSAMPNSIVTQIRGGQYDGTYSGDMSMGM